MNYPKSNIIALVAALVVSTAANAQIVGKSTDTNYYNTTIIYKKGEIKDNDILSKVENDYGMGDIVRIADAPPKPEVTPVKKAPQKLTVVETKSKSTNVKAFLSTPDSPVNSRSFPQSAVNTPSKEAVKPVKSVVEIPVTAIKHPKAVTTNNISEKATHTKSAKSIKKKKSRSSKHTFARPAKRQKHGKQQYGCPKF